MQNWKGPSQLTAAEEAYGAAEMDRLQLVCNRRQMEKDEYQGALSAAWLRSVDALEILTALRNAESVTRLREAAE